MSEMGMQAKVGALVLFSLALLVGFIFILGDFSFSDGFEFNVEFENAGGLKPGADVAIAGLNVGNVQRIEFFENKNKQSNMNAVAVRATLSIEKEYAAAVRENSEFFITTRGVLGEPYIEIVTETYQGPAITAGATLRGVDPPRMDLVVSRAMRLLKALTDLLEDPEIATKDLLSNAALLMRTIQEIVEANRPQINGIFAGANTSLDEASKLLGTMNVVVEDGKPVKEMLGDLQVATRDFRVTARSARKLTGELDGRVEPLLDDVEIAVKNARDLSDSANRIVVGNEQKINASIDNLHQSSEDLAMISGDARQMVKQVRDGEGTVGQLLNDREIYDDLKETMRQIKRQPWKILWKE